MVERYQESPKRVFIGDFDPQADEQLNTCGWVKRADVYDEGRGTITRYPVPKYCEQLVMCTELGPFYTKDSRKLNRYLLYDPDKVDVRIIGIPPTKPVNEDAKSQYKNLLDSLAKAGYRPIDYTPTIAAVVKYIKQSEDE